MSKYKMITALMHDCRAQIEMAKCNTWIYLNNPVGVGDHPDIMKTIQGQLDIISQNQDRLKVLEEYFDGEE